MNKLIILVLTLLIFSFNNNAQTSIVLIIKDANIKPDSIIKIDFSYLPWNIAPWGILNEEDVRAYDDKTTNYSINNKEIIEEITKSLTLLDIIGVYDGKNGIDVRMVVDFYYKSGKKETLLIDSNGHFKYKDMYFGINCTFIQTILKHVPLATIPPSIK